MKNRITYLGAVAVALAVSAMVQPLAAQSKPILAHPPVSRIAKPPVLVHTSQPLPIGPWEGTLQLSTNTGLSWSKTASTTFATPCPNGGAPATCGLNPVASFMLRWAEDPNRNPGGYYSVSATQLTPPPSQAIGPGNCDSPANFTQAISFQAMARPNFAAGTTLVCQYVVTVTDVDAHGHQSTRATQPVTISIQVRSK
ncbi:MAG TPA: hypothetical protein VNE60_14515 [Gemmatimonadaceae bacterium]|nr:hypothetical protein [Gemmatimonadaceae bacterium]